MTGAELLTLLPGARVVGALPPSITGVSFDSRTTAPGDLFVARTGLASDGHRFAADAAARGAAAVVAERMPEPAIDLPVILVPDSREALARVAAALHDWPSRKLTLVGVTGTNGKTTSTHFLTAVAAAAGRRTGRIGTVGYDIAGTTLDAPHTTPEAPVLEELLARMVAARVDFCAMEVSSHALEQRRSFGLDFRGVLFTNLTQDHLDYHHDFDAYYAAKRRLFSAAGRGSDMPAVAAINIDDAHGRRLAREAAPPVVTFAVESPADYRASVLSMDNAGSDVAFEMPGGRLTARLGMVGPFNVMNALGAAALMTELGYDADTVRRGLESLHGVPGRMERVDRGQPFSVLVDYAHTPDALERVLLAAREATTGRLTAVFGCGGDRDRTKRPIMGRLATQIADHAIVTSDNPRSEVPEAIVAEIVAGAREGGGSFDVVVDRRTAIETALRAAGPGDTVVIAGKGHEPYQILADRTIHFDDREEAARVLGELGWRKTGGAGGHHPDR
jgi:UDP-N-acetylmuramoyl-L-alanyl-D-glutamate--2,6-diaminopimelate ligase